MTFGPSKILFKGHLFGGFFFVQLCFIIVFFASCENDISKIETITDNTVYPAEIARNITIQQTDSSYLRIEIFAEELYRYLDEENPYTEFTKGVDVKFFDKFGAITSSVKSKYAVDYPNKNIMEAKEDVEVVNAEGEILNTEHLIWLRDEKRLISDVFVKITTSDEVIFGEGLDAKEDFSAYKIKNMKGIIKVRDL